MVKNEAKYLEECLKSLQPIREAIESELVIVDTGSDDGTVEIAKQFTDKVYFHEWNDHFSEMRNTVISYTKGDWYFSIDGDEVVENPEGFIHFFQSGKYKEFNSALVTQKNYINKEKTNVSNLLVPRVFKNDEDFHFEGAIHNQPVVKKPVCTLDTVLEHYGYLQNDQELMERKFNRTSNILKRELENDPENIYYRFQLANSYGMHGDYDKAIENIEKTYEVVNQKKTDLSSYLYIHNLMAKMYLGQNRLSEAEKICKEAIGLAKGYYSDLYYYLGKAQLKLNKNEEAIENFKIYLDIVEKDGPLEQINDTSFIFYTEDNLEQAYLFLLVLYERIEDYEQIINVSYKIKSKDNIKQVIPKAIKACVETDRFNEIKNYYQNKILTEFKDLSGKYLAELESKMMTMNKEKKYNIFNVFSVEKSSYGILNKVRLRELKDNKLVNLITKMNFNSLPNYYGDIIYYLLQNKYFLVDVCGVIQEQRLNKFLQYVLDDNKEENISSVLYEYLENRFNVETLSHLNINKVLERYILVLDDLNNEKYFNIFRRYIEDGTKYIKMVYSDEIIQNEMTQFVKNDEEVFLLYIYLANQHKENNPKKYVRYLRKSLDAFPAMKKGIQMLLERFEKKDTLNGGLENYQEKIKNNIDKLINNGNLKKAEELINEYEDTIEDDAEIYSMKSVIAIMKNNFKKAKKIIKNGLEIEPDNFDLLYNLGYVYEELNQYNQAKDYYLQAKNSINSSKQKDDLAQALKRIEEKTKEVEEKYGL